MAGPIEQLGLALYGKYWKSPLARALDIPSDTLTRWRSLSTSEQQDKMRQHGGLKLVSDKRRLLAQITMAYNEKEAS
jgi:hypothetical protein